MDIDKDKPVKRRGLGEYVHSDDFKPKKKAAKKKASKKKVVNKKVNKPKEPTKEVVSPPDAKPEPRLQGFAKPPPEKVVIEEEKPKEFKNTGKAIKCTYRMAMRVQGDYKLQARAYVNDAWNTLAHVKNEEEARIIIKQIAPPVIEL